MSVLHRTLLLGAFLAAAGWQILMGTLPGPGPLPTQVPVPPAPQGWKLVEQQPENTWAARTPGVRAVYAAPDGSRATLVRYVGWPDRREHLPAFLPHECWYSGQGWDFDIRSALQKYGDQSLRLIQVHRRTNTGVEKYVELSAYACSDRLCATWQEYKAVLIWQRALRQRRLWNYAYITAAPGTQALRGAPDLLVESLKLEELSLSARSGSSTRPDEDS